MNAKTSAMQKGNSSSPLSDYFVGRKIVNDRVKRYKEGKQKILSEEMKKKEFFQGESDYVWYSKVYIESLLSEMEIYSANGVRVYFGEYGGEPGDPPPAGQLGLMFVLTEEQPDGVTRDIILEDKSNFAVRELASKNKNTGSAAISNEREAREYNIFDPSPPARFNHESSFPEETPPVSEN